MHGIGKAAISMDSPFSYLPSLSLSLLLPFCLFHFNTGISRFQKSPQVLNTNTCGQVGPRISNTQGGKHRNSGEDWLLDQEGERACAFWPDVLSPWGRWMSCFLWTCDSSKQLIKPCYARHLLPIHSRWLENVADYPCSPHSPAFSPEREEGHLQALTNTDPPPRRTEEIVGARTLPPGLHLSWWTNMSSLIPGCD